MNLTYNPNKSRNEELLEYLVTTKLKAAENNYIENRKNHTCAKTSKITVLDYVNNLFIIKSMYADEVDGLKIGIKEMVEKLMSEFSLNSLEVSKYIEARNDMINRAS